jgi:hypothetical protein
MKTNNSKRPSRKTQKKPQARRLDAQGQRQYKEKRAQLTSAAGRYKPSSRQERQDDKKGKPNPERADNVNLFLSPRLLDLAEELANESGMSIRHYLSEALKYILLAHGKRLGKSDKYVAEFKSENRRTVKTWKPDEKIDKD